MKSQNQTESVFGITQTMRFSEFSASYGLILSRRIFLSCILVIVFHNSMADEGEISANKAIDLLEGQIHELRNIAKKAKNVNFKPYDNIDYFPALQKFHAPAIEMCEKFWTDLLEDSPLNVPKPVFIVEGESGERIILQEIMAYVKAKSGDQSAKSKIDFEGRQLFDPNATGETLKQLADKIKYLREHEHNPKNEIFDRKNAMYLLYLYQNYKDNYFLPMILPIYPEHNNHDFSMSKPKKLLHVSDYYKEEFDDYGYDGFLSKSFIENKVNVVKFSSETYDTVWETKVPWMPRPGIVKGLIQYKNKIFNFSIAETNYRSPIIYSHQEIVDGRESIVYEFQFIANEAGLPSSCQINFNY